MVERVVLSALIMGFLAFLVYDWMIEQGWALEEDRNGILLLMVLFENVQAFNSRSKTLSVFRHNPLRNRLLLLGTIIAQLVHILAMYTPGISDVLGIAPVSIEQWLTLLGFALILLVSMELDKAIRRFKMGGARSGQSPPRRQNG